jgi:hypothetical protein
MWADVLGVHGPVFDMHVFIHAEDCYWAHHFILHPPYVCCSWLSFWDSSLRGCMAHTFWLHVSHLLLGSLTPVNRWFVVLGFKLGAFYVQNVSI